jgi:anti-anti-sigma factor
MKHQYQNDTLFLAFEGDVLSSSADILREEFNKIFDISGRAAACRSIELDLTKAKMMDSAGLNFIMTILKQAKARNARVVARIASKTVHRIFLFTRLDKHLELLMQE